ncbi:DUF2332 family protein [Sphingomonas sp. RP10(2022)]|uniref:DUF2332 family protein n=1 Tax=Sphingomonas liriopis TaxID=2949094 RepID=A0A9X2HUI5_9SPHN|nr:DUF2332 family protein [Sphingomonas liriopis]MCP3735749.1 DUF2332 family protein [Sphingomonas liriopis]
MQYDSSPADPLAQAPMGPLARQPMGPLARQGAAVRTMGSDFVAAILEAGERQLYRAPRTAALIAAWPRDAAADAIAMRFNAALHALARGGTLPALAALYRSYTGDIDRVVGDAMAAADAAIAEAMQACPQTNEVGRTAAIMAALTVLRGLHDMPCDLRELGASAGLNLNLDRYAYDLGGHPAGDPASPVRIAPSWTGPAPHPRAVEIASARGVDLSPIDVADAAACERLMAYVWADEPERADRLAQALAIARMRPPQVNRGDIAGWLPAELAAPQPTGVCRTFVHAMALQYLDATSRAAVEDAFRDAGARATAARPLARIGFEWTPARDAVHLLLTSWPDGVTRHLATCHAYGAWIDWHVPARQISRSA